MLHIYATRQQNVDIFKVKEGNTYSYDCPLED
jgi:hypothetical protein